MNRKLSVRDIDLQGKKVLIRVDFNVPLENGRVMDDTRIKASLPTIQYVLNQGGIPILMSHLGRPEGKPNPTFSLAPCAKHLSKLLNQSVKMAPDCVGEDVKKMVKDLRSGEILMLENLRFHVGEEDPKDEPNFAQELAALGDVYVNDAFGSSHRAHASIVNVPSLFKGHAAAGLLLEKELKYLGMHVLNPKRPFYALLGGAKVSTKFKVIESLLEKADALIIGGGMANTFFVAKGYYIGDSFYEKDFVQAARELLEASNHPKTKIFLPIDCVISKDVKSVKEKKIIDIVKGIPKGFNIVDIGPKTVEMFSIELQKAKTVFWNGPMGIYEIHEFAKGTEELAKVIGDLPALTIVGGGDSVAAIEKMGISEQFNHLSTGGGASLEFIELGTLPGIEALGLFKE